jgi:hypothetical protein
MFKHWISPLNLANYFFALQWISRTTLLPMQMVGVNVAMQHFWVQENTWPYILLCKYDFPFRCSHVF